MVMKMKNKFWKWSKNEVTGEKILRLDGVISEESWLGDEVTPKNFRDELNSCDGDIEIYINSPGGDVFAASQIYTMLMEHKGNVAVKIDGLAASAASVIAMAGTTTAMSPTSNMMIHNPFTIQLGDADEMRACAEFLDEIKESIINAYELKTNLPRKKISELMTAETWMNAKKALELGFCDKILFSENETEISNAIIFSPQTVQNSILNKICRKKFFDAENFYKRLNLISH